jgi:hypothetical protein
MFHSLTANFMIGDYLTGHTGSSCSTEVSGRMAEFVLIYILGWLSHTDAVDVMMTTYGVLNFTMPVFFLLCCVIIGSLHDTYVVLLFEPCLYSITLMHERLRRTEPTTIFRRRRTPAGLEVGHERKCHL